MKTIHKILLIGLLLLAVWAAMPLGRAAAVEIGIQPQNAENLAVDSASSAKSTAMELGKAPIWVKGLVLLALVLSAPMAAASLLGEDKRGSLDIR